MAAQLDAIAHRLEQVTDIRAELAELRTMVEKLALNVATLVANNQVQERGLEQPAPAVLDEVLVIETDELPLD